MKLKLQFWKTDKAVAVSVLECEEVPVTTGDGAIEVCFYHTTELFADGEMILNNHETGKISTIEVDNPEEYVDKLVNNIAKELFASRKREAKVGDIVDIDSNGEEYTVVHVLPEEYYNRYIVTSNGGVDKYVGPFGKPKVYALPSIPLVNEKVTFTKDVTGNVETYTWEI